MQILELRRDNSFNETPWCVGEQGSFRYPQSSVKIFWNTVTEPANTLLQNRAQVGNKLR